MRNLDTDIVKRFQFDLEMGLFQINDSEHGYSKIRVKNSKDLLIMVNILSHLVYRYCNDPYEVLDIIHYFNEFPHDVIVYLTIDTKTKRYRINNVPHTNIVKTKSIPSYLNEIEVK